MPVGFGEAFGEAITAQMTMLDYSTGLVDWSEVRTAIAVTLTASIRSRQPPPLAIMFRDGVALPYGLAGRLADLEQALQGAATLVESSEIAADAWEQLQLDHGRAWARAGTRLRAAVARATLAGFAAHERLRTLVDQTRTSSLVEVDAGDTGVVQLMNFNQTKGREADAVILGCMSTDFFGRGEEPWESASRLLYVTLTRARRTIIVLLPEEPHELVRPFGRLSQR